MNASQNYFLEKMALSRSSHINNNAYTVDLPKDKYLVNNSLNISDLSPYHGGEDLDPRTDLSQGGDDAEHPMDITMDISPTCGPLTRAQAWAIETKVNSLLVEIQFHTCETWMLPQNNVLCSLRYNDETEEQVGREDGTTQGI